MFLLVIVLGAISVSSFEFKDSNQPGVEFGNKTSTAQNIIVDEDNTGMINKILVITGVQGDLSMDYDLITQQLLQPLLAKANDQEYALIVNQLDYEKLKAQSIKPNFMVNFSDSASEQTLNILIKNIDDESPTLTSTHCVINEETNIYVEKSDCVLHVTDPDGWLNYLNFSTTNTLFELSYKETPVDDEFETDVYLVLQSSTLDYEENSIHVFEIHAKDGAGHSTTTESVQIVVQVGDIADQPPVWLTTQNSIIVDEETSSTMQVKAIDGDLGVNSTIGYIISDSSVNGFLHIDSRTGLISINPIDREVDFDVATFQVTAYEIPDPESFTIALFTLIVNDIDDNIPEISANGSKELNITIDEGATSIDLDILVSDLDVGENAAYSTELNITGRFANLNVFALTPTQGYQNTSLKISILNPQELDYEISSRRTINMEIRTIGSKTSTNADVLPITINIADVNDEFPVFDQDEYVVSIPENVTIGTVIATINATDKDAEDADGVMYDILGNNALKIEPSGNVTVIKNNTFDYETQNEVRVQIRATDKAGNANITYLIIKVEDINDESPKVSTPLTIIEVEENSKEFDVNVTATDEDTSARLFFSTKTTCVTATTVYKDNHTASAKLNMDCASGLDYESFDTLYVELDVSDLNTDINDNNVSTIVAIKVIDINDNSPKIETLYAKVVENTVPGTVVTTVLATDDDVSDIITYSMKGTYTDTPNWLSIDSYTGIVTVITNEAGPIDCDDPRRTFLYYNVTASDGKHDVTSIISFRIFDENDNAPTLDNKYVTIPENVKNSTIILYLDPIDKDRDEPYNVVSCSFSPATTSDVLNRFLIESNRVYVSLSNGASFNKEMATEFSFELDCVDNPGGTVSLMASPRPKVTITIEDDDEVSTIAKDPKKQKTEDSWLSKSVSRIGRFIDSVINM